MVRKRAVGDAEKRKTGRSSNVLPVVLICIVLVLVILTSYLYAFYNQVQKTERVLLGDVNLEKEYDVDQYFPGHIVNIALLGFDRGWGRENMGQYLFRPDMLALFSLDFDNERISVVRIPRDSYVPIYNTGGFKDRINSAYYHGYKKVQDDEKHARGIESTLETISYVLGDVPIHYYVAVDMYSVIELVDALGGIYYEVEETIYDEHWIIGRVLVPEGPQILDGVTYLRYLQFRGTKTGDYGRIDRQMNLLRATYLYLRENGRIADIPATYRIYKDYVETDLSYKQIAALAFYARDFAVTDDTLMFYTMGGSGGMQDGRWLEVINQAERVRIIAEIFGLQVEQWAPIVLADSPEYLAEQEERKRLEEEQLAAANGQESEEEIEVLSDPAADDKESFADEEMWQGVAEVAIPEVWGLSVEKATATLSEKGLLVSEVIEVSYAHLGNGLVIKTDPIPGRKVPVGSEVDLIVSKGP